MFLWKNSFFFKIISFWKVCLRRQVGHWKLRPELSTLSDGGRLGSQLGSQNGANMVKKSMQKSIKKLMHLKINFWSDFNGFGDGKWSQVGTKIDQKSMPIAKSDFLKNRALAAAGARFLRFWGSKLGARTHQKSIKKWSQHGKASWNSFFFDFGGFGGPSWEAVVQPPGPNWAGCQRAGC